MFKNVAGFLTLLFHRFMNGATLVQAFILVLIHFWQFLASF